MCVLYFVGLLWWVVAALQLAQQLDQCWSSRCQQLGQQQQQQWQSAPMQRQQDSALLLQRHYVVVGAISATEASWSSKDQQLVQRQQWQSPQPLVAADQHFGRQLSCVGRWQLDGLFPMAGAALTAAGAAVTNHTGCGSGGSSSAMVWDQALFFVGPGQWLGSFWYSSRC
jgi:hypothetical protein